MIKIPFDDYLKSCIREDGERQKEKESELAKYICEICRIRRKCPNKSPCATAEAMAEGLKIKGYRK